LSPQVARADATVERIGEWMSGLWHADVQAHLAQAQQGAAMEANHV
jgi:simple sugar transport system ATP-binding protein